MLYQFIARLIVRPAEFLAQVLGDAGYETTVLESAPGRGNLVARLAGRAGDPGGALCLLHHLDVVPADPSEWSVDPFGAEIRDGYLWGRGAIDMKSMGVMQLMTMLALARDRTTTVERDVVFVAVARGIGDCELLAGDVRRGPLARSLSYPYHPHVTVAHDVPPDMLELAYSGLSDLSAEFRVQHFTEFEQTPGGAWTVAREYPLSGPAR